VRAELLLRQVALDARPLLAVRVQDEDRRRPQGVEAVEVGGATKFSLMKFDTSPSA
jgi:hypothetical protein